MKKNLIRVLCAFLICTAAIILPACAKAQAQNDYWVATFQLIWNDLMDEIVKGPVEFVGGNPPLATELNKQSFKADMLSEDSYYKILDKKSPELKAKIEKDIYEKFHEKSDILDKFDWSVKKTDVYFLYAMLKKDFVFGVPFDVLKADRFANSWSKYKYFGVDSKSQKPMRKNVKVLFYNNDKDFAVALQSDDKEEAILYRTNDKDSFENLYKSVEEKSKKGHARFGDKDTLKVPFIEINKEQSFDELCGKEIKNTDRLLIGKALQTVQFSMDNKGGKIKSEAAMDIMKMSLVVEKPRHYNFDKRFVLFLKEKDKSQPYFALDVKNTEYLVK